MDQFESLIQLVSRGLLAFVPCHHDHGPEPQHYSQFYSLFLNQDLADPKQILILISLQDTLFHPSENSFLPFIWLS